MPITIPLDKMTIEDKLVAMELIWDDLYKTEDRIISPAWHEKILNARDESITRGEACFMDWEVAKREIRDEVS